MQIITKKLSELVKPQKNIRIHSEQQLREFERSVKMFGQIRPIVIDENNVILAGNGLYDTMFRMGYEEAEVYQYTDLSNNQKKKLMIADNKIFSLGIENLDTLNSFLEELHDDLDIPGYDSEILRQMMAEAEDVTEKLAEYGTLDKSEVQAIREQTERRESRQEPELTLLSSNEQETPVIPTSEIIQEEEDKQTADIRKFVVCPACGEKIWL